MKAVTIAVGEEYHARARAAAHRVRQHSGLDVIVFGEPEYRWVAKKFPGFDKLYPPHRVYLLKFWLFDFLPEESELLYFDIDWSPLRRFDPAPLVSDRLTVVRDRSAAIMADQQRFGSDCLHYFNAGFFVATRDHHPFFKHCRENYHVPKNLYGDQCVMNHWAQKGRIGLNFADRRWNCMDYVGQWKHCDLFALHSSVNYQFFADGTAACPDVIHEWDIDRMFAEAGPAEFRGKWLELFPDGTRSDGHVWFIDKTGQTTHMTVFGEILHP